MRRVPPPDSVREQFGSIALISTLSPLAIPKQPWASGPGKVALVGFGQGFFGTLSSSAGGGGAGAILSLLLAPPAGLVGAVVGASRARSKEEVEETDAVFRSFLTQEPFDQELTQRVLAATLSHAPENRISLVEAQDIDPANLSAKPGGLTALGYDSALEVTLTYGFLVEGEISPSVALDALVEAKDLSRRVRRPIVSTPLALCGCKK